MHYWRSGFACGLGAGSFGTTVPKFDQNTPALNVYLFRQGQSFVRTIRIASAFIVAIAISVSAAINTTMMKKPKL